MEIVNRNYIPTKLIKPQLTDTQWRELETVVPTYSLLKPNKYTVQFKEWKNNWEEMSQPEHCIDLGYAISRADKFYTFETTQSTEPGFENCYYNNGCETWVEDDKGNIIYTPKH